MWQKRNWCSMFLFYVLNRGLVLYSLHINSVTGSFFGRYSHPASQEIPRLLWHPKVHYRVHKGPSLVPTLSQTYPVHTTPPYLPKIHSNIILPFKPRSSEWSLAFRFSSVALDVIKNPSNSKALKRC